MKPSLTKMKGEIKKIEESRLIALLEESGIVPEEGKDVIETYESALGISQSGYKIVHKRDINEIFVNKEQLINIIST